MRMRRGCVLVAAVSLLVLSSAGCGSKTAPPPPQDRSTHEENPASHPRPATKEGSLDLEGFKEPFTFRLFDAPDLPFVAYYPEDMLAEAASSGEGDTARFVANFGGVRQDNAYLQVPFYQRGMTADEAREAARAAAATRGTVERRADAPARYGWSLAEYDFAYRDKDGTWMMGTVAPGSHGDRFFQVILHYPEDYSEGFGPRADRILAEWRWRDTDQGL